MADQPGPDSSPLALLIASVASLAWLVYVAFATLSDGNFLLAAGPRDWVALVAQASVPVAACFAIVAALRRTPPAAPALGVASEVLEESEARFTGLVSRVDSVRALLARDLDAVSGTTQALEASARTSQALLADIVSATQAAAASGESLAASLPQSAEAAAAINRALQDAGAEAGRQTEAVGAAAQRLLESSENMRGQGETVVAALSEALAGLSRRASETGSEGRTMLAGVMADADAAFATTADALLSMREGVAQQSQALAASLAEARATLDLIGGDAARAVGRRLEGLASQAESIEARLQAQIATAELLGTQAERSFKLLDARLTHSADTSQSTLDSLGTRIQTVTATMSALVEPLRETRAATAELESGVASLRESALQTVDILAETLPVRTVEASKAADTMTTELRALASIIDEAHAKAAALADPIAHSRAALLEATEGYAAQRIAIETAGQALVVELEQARQLISQVEDQTRDTSLAAASRLVDAMTRVREVAQQTAGTMRETLDGVIGEARASLATAADTAMRQSFAGPIVAQAREAETIAQAASERTAASMAALAGTLKLLDSRASERSASLEEAASRDLLAAATLLTDRLASKAVSIASALGKPMTDADWAQWRSGERSMFNRRAISMLEKRESRAVKALLASDPEFADAARHYTADFDALVARMGQSPHSPVASALLSSEPGRLAAALIEVLED